jgi:6-phosphogluconolactonase (cycloisomerase 2 family)
MRASRILGAALAAGAAALALTAGPASALGASGAVFVQSDNTLGNEIVAYDRAPDGTLSQAGAYPTGGLGGQLEGSVVDHLASQSSLLYDRPNGLLYAVNAGSGTISVFAVFGNRLALRQVIPSGGPFPVSIAASGGLVYVLNAEEGGSLTGFRVVEGRLQPIAGSGRELGLNASATPQFVNTPGQVAFSPGGTQLVITTKANGNDVDVFAVAPSGLLGRRPTVDELPGAVPFAVSFDAESHLLLTEAGPNALASFALAQNGKLAQLDAVPTGQAATCWVLRIGDRFYVSNAGSASLSGFRSQAGGQLLAPLGNTATDAGTVDSSVTPGGRFVYVQTGGAGIVDEFAVQGTGALEPVGSVTVPGAVGGEGIVAP